ncbi:unnamed protein product [Camellia sinensis]
MKRKIIGKEFICIFDAFAQDLEHKLRRKHAYLVQGTLCPDVIESCPTPGSGRTHSHAIKSHHNVGGLPNDMKLKLIEPLKLLFKDEVFAYISLQTLHILFYDSLLCRFLFYFVFSQWFVKWGGSWMFLQHFLNATLSLGSTLQYELWVMSLCLGNPLPGG